MQKNTGFSERVMQVIDFVGDTKNEFAKKLGYERSQSIYDIVNGKSKPSFDFFEKLLNSEYSEIINIEYIISGKGNLDKTKSKENLTLSKGKEKGKEKGKKLNVQETLPNETKSEENINKENVNKKVNINVNKPNVQKILTNEPQDDGIYDIVSLPTNRKTKDAVYSIQEIPLYDLEAAAGLKELFSGGKSATQILDTIRIPHLPKCDGAISITGDSMYPLLKSGDMVLYKEIPLDSIFYGEMYLLAYQIDEWEEYITVKYVQKSELGDDYLKLVSQNQHHQPRDVKKAQITAIAIIKASIRINTMM